MYHVIALLLLGIFDTTFRVSLSESKKYQSKIMLFIFQLRPIVPKFNSLGGLSLTYDGTRKVKTVATFQINSLKNMVLQILIMKCYFNVYLYQTYFTLLHYCYNRKLSFIRR